MSADLLKTLDQRMSAFSKGQRSIASYITQHYDKAAFYTAAKLGRTVGVSESTVVRFADELGYGGYPQMQEALQELIRTKLTSVQRIEATGNRFGDDDLLAQVLQNEIGNIKHTLEQLDNAAFDSAADAISHGRGIYLLGLRSSSMLAGFIYLYFKISYGCVHYILPLSYSEMQEQLLHIGPDDVIIGISFPRYSRRTVSLLEYAKARRATVVVITDSQLSPLCAMADHILLARSDMVSLVDSLVAPLCVINALIASVSKRREQYVQGMLGELEGVWDENNVYEKPREN